MRTDRILRAIRRPDREFAPSTTRSQPDAESRVRQLGQVLPIFAVMSVVLLGGAALLTDAAWWWTNELKAQRAADAAALAGAVYLPGDEGRAFLAALAEAEKNGYVNGVGGVAVSPRRDDNVPFNDRKLIVDISGPVETNFARVFCWDGGPCLRTVDVGVSSAAEFVLPVPMGSPENYYGVFGVARGLTSTSTQVVPVTTRDWSCGSVASWSSASCTGRIPSAAPSGSWFATSGNLVDAVRSNNDVYARSNTTGAQQQWSGFNAQNGMPIPGAGESLTIAGLQVRLRDAFVNFACVNGRIDTELSWGGGAAGTWSNPVAVPVSGSLDTNTFADYFVGNNSNLTAWGGHTWTRADFSDANFRIRLTSVGSGCTFSVDMVEVRVTWDYSTTTTQNVTTNLGDVPLRGPGTACTTGKVDCFEADGSNLNPRGFWGTLNTQGAENVDGDAHQPGYDTRTSGVSRPCPSDTMACYDGVAYYNYAIEMPPGSTGAVYVYDPQHCGVDNNRGTGDRWFSSGGRNAVSTFYDIYDTNETLYDYTDDGSPIASSGSLFRGLYASDPTMTSGTAYGSDCRYRTDTQYGDGRDYHNRWYRLYDNLSGGPDGRIYRVHTTSTDAANPTQQLGTDGENSFAIYVSASSGNPRVYGLGAMQAYTPLTANGPEQVSEFYLAQIGAEHRGKTIQIKLWDPGDTRPLQARLQILIPTSTGWTPTDFSYTASRGTTNSAAANCDSLTGSGVNIVTTNIGNTNGTFNGCWITLQAQIPSDYCAPPGDIDESCANEQDGWWRIRYRMEGTGTSNDVTTWKVNLIGNPVHLVQP